MPGCYTWHIHLIKITIFSIENSDNYWWSSFGHRDLIRNESFNTFDGFEFIHQEDFWDCWTKYFVVHLEVGFMVYTYFTQRSLISVGKLTVEVECYFHSCYRWENMELGHFLCRWKNLRWEKFLKKINVFSTSEHNKFLGWYKMPLFWSERKHLFLKGRSKRPFLQPKGKSFEQERSKNKRTAHLYSVFSS